MIISAFHVKFFFNSTFRSSYALFHNLYESEYSTAVLCPKYPGMKGYDRNVSFQIKYATVSYSQHIVPWWISLLNDLDC